MTDKEADDLLHEAFQRDLDQHKFRSEKLLVLKDGMVFKHLTPWGAYACVFVLSSALTSLVVWALGGFR